MMKILVSSSSRFEILVVCSFDKKVFNFPPKQSAYFPDRSA